MKIFKLFIIGAVFVTLAGCSSAPVGNEQDAEFLSMADNFIAAFNSKNVSEINSYINKDYGFFVINNPGAYTISTHFNSFNDIMSMESQYGIGNLKNEKVNWTAPRRGLEPVYSCDNEGWNKSGNFYGTQKDINLAELYKGLVDFELYTEDEVREPMRLAGLSENNFAYFMYNTEEEIGFYFGYKNGSYYLMAIDIVEPCSA